MQPSSDLAKRSPRWTDSVYGEDRRPPCGQRFTVGVLPGEGIGPEVMAAALAVLSSAQVGDVRFDVQTGGPIGRDAELLSGKALTEGVIRFCDEVFSAGGAVLAGPGGSRFVYDLRREFDLYCKLSPLRPIEPLLDAGRLKRSAIAGTDILVVRENVGGEYLGEWRETTDARRGRICSHSFYYAEDQVRRLLRAAARLAASRRGRLTVVIKDGGLPTVSALWRDLGREAASESGVELRMVDIDLTAYLMLQDPLAFDVIAATNLFGDVLADLGAVLLSSRGVSFSGNFAESGAAVYQTNHGSALDLAGQGRANPIGQISSVAMMLRESFGLHAEAGWIEAAVEDVLRQGFRTFDIAVNGSGSTAVGTEEMGQRIAAAVERRARPGE